VNPNPDEYELAELQSDGTSDSTGEGPPLCANRSKLGDWGRVRLSPPGALRMATGDARDRSGFAAGGVSGLESFGRVTRPALVSGRPSATAFPGVGSSGESPELVAGLPFTEEDGPGKR